VPLAHNGSGVFGAKRLFLASMSCVKAIEARLGHELSGLALNAKGMTLH